MASNKEIEEEAIKFVKSRYKNVRKAKPGLGFDLGIGNKVVEVKGTATNNRKQNIFLSTSQNTMLSKNMENIIGFIEL